MSDTKAQIRSFLGQFVGDHELGDEEDIFASGYVNSLFIMQLVLFVESELGCPVEDEDLEIENFRSVDAIARTVARRRAAVGVC
jgi:acyl carrier protein